MQFPVIGNVRIPVKQKYSVESHFSPSMWFSEEIKSYYKTQIIHKVWVMQNFVLQEYYGKINIFSSYGP